MGINFCLKTFSFLGIHPNHPVDRLHVIFNNVLAACLLLLTVLKCYLDRDLTTIESCSGILIMSIKYLALAFGRRKANEMWKAMDNFWKINKEDDQVTYYMRHYEGVQKMYKYLLAVAILTHALKPFFVRGTSIYDCYIPPHIPFALFYAVEFYVMLFATVLFVSFNIFICWLIILVVVQFRMLNLKIKDLHFVEVEDDQDMATYAGGLKVIIKHQQFLMRLVNDLNDLLSVPIALLMVTSITMMCIIMYIITIAEGSISDEGRLIIISCAIVVEFFMVYGLPAQLLMDESEATADVIYSECKWYLPKLRPLRQDFLIMIARSQKTVSIRAANYHVVNNQTVLLILKTAYSFYTFLQNVTVVNNN